MEKLYESVRMGRCIFDGRDSLLELNLEIMLPFGKEKTLCFGKLN